ncbi:TetR/AcrR family transcriptional regulator [Caulobacter sp. BK020]|uniref:TetR/AcrR family transcriptional regulator n=1 Tax=Caulobacter sp. BK020 TaxID=2512117 RepID=UPI001049B154|nr:TetR/AcrR family transcriptional regulator [Caulobacter sp. BK020]TCS17474.1 TetR family transcriptional regulator [Caulobacter sp. BK020]
MKAKPQTPNPGHRPASDRLVDAATELFYQHGYRAIGVDEIAARSGVTKTTLYRYFESKDDLAAACLTRLALEDLDQLMAIAQQHPDDPVAQIRAIVSSAAVKVTQPGYRGWLLSNLEAEISDQDHPIRRVARLYKTRLRDHLVETARQAGFGAPASLADGLLLLIEGVGASWHSLGAVGPAAKLALSCELLMQGHRTVAHAA